MKNPISSFVAALAMSCMAAPASAVTFGTPDGNGHPFVGTLLFERVDGYYSCTGTLMSPTVVLTAAHCAEEAGVPNLRTWVKFSPQISVQSGCAGNHACLNGYLDNPANGWTSGTAHAHPSYDDFSQFPATYDIGVIVLDSPVPMATYGELPSLGFLATIHSASENKFTVVGYGMQGIVGPFFSDIWERYAGKIRLLEVNSAWNGGHSAKFSNNPGTGGGTCFGDSGGPIFYANTNIVVAVVSWGLTPCIGADYNFRTDIPAAQGFVDPYLD